GQEGPDGQPPNGERADRQGNPTAVGRRPGPQGTDGLDTGTGRRGTGRQTGEHEPPL
ncbi:uncharacterized protein METZ01_LOCUS511236, partial [marine metagenome]